MNQAVERFGRAASVALAFAAAYGVSLIAGAFLVPVYQTSGSSQASGSPAAQVAQGSATLVGVNGPRVAFIAAVPLAVTLAVAVALWLNRPGARVLAWALTGLLAVFNLLAMLSIGIFVLPVTVALIVACITGKPRGSRAPTGTAARPMGAP